jgi:hypothetical protein
MSINKELLDLPPASENLYKFIVIIGLSLFLVPSLNTTNLVSIMSKRSEIGRNLNNIGNEINQKFELLALIENEIKLNNEEINNGINNIIKNMNYSFPNGEQVLSINDLENFIKIVIKLINEIIEDDNNGIDINLIENKLYKLNIMFGNTDKYENILQNVNNILQKINDTKIIIDNTDVFILQKTDELNTINLKILNEKSEAARISIEVKNLTSEVERIKIEYRLYSTEKFIYDFSRIIGVLLVVFGSVLWYLKIQKYIDKIYKG